METFVRIWREGSLKGMSVQSFEKLVVNTSMCSGMSVLEVPSHVVEDTEDQIRDGG